MASSSAFSPLLLVVIISVSGTHGAEMAACSSEIFCKGDLLHEVQMHRLFEDSKTFVDLRMKSSPDVVLQKFRELGNITSEKLQMFLKEHFYSKPENDLEIWSPPDWTSSPKIIQKIVDKNLREFAEVLNEVWKKLGRKIKEEAKANINRSSLIIVDKPFIIPGGRFREYYYWDSYWVLKGLLLCDMKETARGMILNFLQLVNKFGFVPNGGRIYYTNRSQPPFLIPMVELYLAFTNDTDFVKDNLQTLVKEYEFWQSNRKVSVIVGGDSYDLNIYSAQMNTPRPESYYEDFETAKGLKTTAEKQALYQNIASAAESGWDFSTRWFTQTGPGKESMSTIRTRQIVPVDLNSILYKSEKILEKFYNLTGDDTNALKYKTSADKRRKAIEAIMWNETAGLYQDYDLERKERTSAFFASSMVPFWAGVHVGNVGKESKVVKALKDLKVLNYRGGFPTSLTDSNQQWDFPNAWPPLQHMAIEGLASSSDTAIQDEAFKLAQKWVQTNWRAWKQSKAIYEKYNALKQGDPGHGGEYKVQLGFGWTNGVILDLLHKYPDKLKVSPLTDSKGSTTFPSISLLAPFTLMCLT